VNIVAIETATETVGVAVRAKSGVEAAFTLRGRRRHVETLAPALEHLLDQVGLAATDLEVVAVDLGPGLFTGLRVGVAAAKGLAQAIGIGVVGLSSLDILTRAAADSGHTGHLLAAVDARRGEVFACVRELRAEGDPAEDVIGAGLFSPEELAAALSELGGVRIVGVGDGAQRYAGVLGDVPGVSCVMDALDAPPPLTLLAMAADLYDAGAPPVAPHLVVPRYMRAADATSNFAQVTPT
jgi:tRNA threonylcarbamoyladenosine biosynthesis protein TsaB